MIRGWRLLRDDSGQSMLETLIVLPVILLLMLLVMEAGFAYNAKQLADYAAYCAARTAAVHGTGPEGREKMQYAAALALMGSPPPAGAEYTTIKWYFGFRDDYLDPLREELNPPGGMDGWMRRFAAANLRVRVLHPEVRSNGNRQSVTVVVEYLHFCPLLPLGAALVPHVVQWLTQLAGQRPALSSLYINMIQQRNRNVIVRGRAVLDYWPQ